MIHAIDPALGLDDHTAFPPRQLHMNRPVQAVTSVDSNRPRFVAHTRLIPVVDEFMRTAGKRQLQEAKS